MLMFTFLVLCAVSLRSLYVVRADSPESVFDNLIEECGKLYDGPTRAEMMAVPQSRDLSGIDPCFWDCYFGKVGILNDKGEYDLDNGLAFYRKQIEDDATYASMEKIAIECQSVQDVAVKDGNAECERGALVAECFTKMMKEQDVQSTL